MRVRPQTRVIDKGGDGVERSERNRDRDDKSIEEIGRETHKKASR